MQAAKPTGSDWELRLVKMLRLLGLCCGVATIICSIFSFILFGWINPRTLIANVYLMIFGTAMIVAELRLVLLLKYCYFLQHYAGLGLFYIFVGGLILNEHWWMVLVAVVLIAVGLVYLILGCMCRRMNPKPILLPGQQATGGGLSGQYASDDPQYEPSSTGGGGGAYGYSSNTPSWVAGTSGQNINAYGGMVQPTYTAPAAGGGASGWGLNVGGVNVSAAQAMQGVSVAQSMGLTADHMVQGAQAAGRAHNAYSQSGFGGGSTQQPSAYGS